MTEMLSKYSNNQIINNPLKYFTFHITKINMIILSDSTILALFHITADRELSLKRPLSGAETPFKCEQTLQFQF
jgi:hypothetical protein